MVLGFYEIKGDKKLEDLLTSYFAESLRGAGYNTVVQEVPLSPVPSDQLFDVIVKGDINKFWLNCYASGWHDVAVNIKMIDPVSGNVIWEKEIQGTHTNILWFGMPSEIEEVIRQSLTKTLNEAIKEF